MAVNGRPDNAPDLFKVCRYSRPDDTLRQKPMDERRKYPRIELNEPGLVSAAGAVMHCLVRNISPEGAAIEVDNPAFVPARFRLVMENGAKVRECSVAWIQRNRIGLTFIAVPQTPGANGADD